MPALFLTACNSDQGGGQSGGPVPPTAKASAGKTAGSGAGSGAETGGAKTPQGSGNGPKLAARIALTPAEWGKDFAKDDPYEDATLDYSVLDASCKVQTTHAPASLSGVMVRYVRLPTPGKTDEFTNMGWTNAYVYGTVADARRDFAESKSGTQRCRAVPGGDSKVDTKNVHLATAPAVPLADEIFSEEGQEIFTQDHSGPFPYVTLTARRGTVTVVASIDGAEDSSLPELRGRAQGAITVMLAKVEAQSAGAPLG